MTGPNQIITCPRWRQNWASAPSPGLRTYAVRAALPGTCATARKIIGVARCARQARSTARGQLWAQAAALDTATLFGGFRINPVTGAQVKHEAALVRWTSGGLALA